MGKTQPIVSALAFWPSVAFSFRVQPIRKFGTCNRAFGNH